MERYFKGTRKGGISFYDRKFIYHLGLNVHPSPDRRSDISCGAGLHLAKSLSALDSLAPGAEEIYLAEPGVILAEDVGKVRVAYCWLRRQLSQKEIATIRATESPKTDKYLCGDDWFRKHALDVTMEDIEKQTIEITGGRVRLTLTNTQGIKHKVLRESLKGALS